MEHSCRGRWGVRGSHKREQGPNEHSLFGLSWQKISVIPRLLSWNALLVRPAVQRTDGQTHEQIKQTDGARAGQVQGGAKATDPFPNERYGDQVRFGYSAEER